MKRSAIYQLFIRHFSEGKMVGVVDAEGVRQETCGTFNGVTTEALLSIANTGFTHVWFTGVLEHTTHQSYPHRSADPKGLVRGNAGNPFAVTDYFDVAADLAENPDERLKEFQELIQRTHDAGMKCLIDFIPNHVARSYGSDVDDATPLGSGDDNTKPYAPDNAFYYLPGEGTLTLPSERGVYIPEQNCGRVSGNGAARWSPTPNDWWDTIKLNYGYDYNAKATLLALPAKEAGSEVPVTWLKMYQVLCYWAEMGVDGVRCHDAQLVPVRFWAWLLGQLRQNHPEFTVMGETTSPGGAKYLPSVTSQDYIAAGFSAYDDDKTYLAVKNVLRGEMTVQDLEGHLLNHHTLEYGVRYIERHDHLRVTAPNFFGNESQNLAACAAVWLSGKAPILLYNGQEIGECSPKGKTPIYDYASFPQLQHCYKGREINYEMQQLRIRYKSLVRLAINEPFAAGEIYGISRANPELVSQKVFSFLRFTEGAERRVYLVLCYLGAEDEKEYDVVIPREALDYMGLRPKSINAIEVFSAKSLPVQQEKGGSFSLVLQRESAYSLLRLSLS